MGRMITIIGGGNLGASIAEGLLKSKFCKPAELTVTKRNISTLKALERTLFRRPQRLSLRKA